MSSSDELLGTTLLNDIVILNDCLITLTQAIQVQTQAITALAASNEAIVNAMLGPDDEADPDAPTHYLNGQPIGH